MLFEKAGDIQEDLSKRHLNLEKIFSLSESDKNLIIKLYDDLMNAFDSKGSTISGMPQMDILRIFTIYNTLVEGDYLVTKRESNLDKILS